MHDEESECSFKPLHDLAQGLGEVPGLPVGVADEVSGDLGVGLAREDGLRMLVDEFGPQLREVLDDAVVDERKPAPVTEVRMGVGVGGATVGGPASVADAGGAVGDRGAAEFVDKDAELAGVLAHREGSLSVEHGDAGRVVAAVLEAFEPAQEHPDTAATADVSYDSTHVVNPK